MFKIGIMGGADEIGKSMLYVEYKKSAIVIDCGMDFPDELSNFGVNKIVSYGSYIKNNLHKIKGLYITHMHEDHIGGVRRFVEKYNIPIYAEPLTCEYLKLKNSFRETVSLNPIKCNALINLGSFKLRPFEVEHSTLKAYGYELITKQGNIVVTGDFKLGNCNEDAIKGLKKWGIRKSPLILISESTNANNIGYSKHESDIIGNIDSLIKNYKNEILIISTFASNMDRLKRIIESAESHNSDVFVVGRNMEIGIQFLIKQGLVNESNIKFVSDNIKRIPDRAVVLCTGCQGEPSGGLYKVVEALKDREKKTVLFSSSIIPGNEIQVNNIKIALAKANFKYIEGSDLFHTSGHAKQDELKCMLKLLQPKYFIPVHGDYIKQLANKQNAIENNIKEENIILVENNSLIKFTKNSISVDHITDHLEYITNNGVTKESTIAKKQQIAKNGMFVYFITGRYIKYEPIGIPEKCKLNRLGRDFIKTFLDNNQGLVNKQEFKEQCQEFLLKELKNKDNIPEICIMLIDNKKKKTR